MEAIKHVVFLCYIKGREHLSAKVYTRLIGTDARRGISRVVLAGLFAAIILVVIDATSNFRPIASISAEDTVASSANIGIAEIMPASQERFLALPGNGRQPSFLTTQENGNQLGFLALQGNGYQPSFLATQENEYQPSFLATQENEYQLGFLATQENEYQPSFLMPQENVYQLGFLATQKAEAGTETHDAAGTEDATVPSLGGFYEKYKHLAIEHSAGAADSGDALYQGAALDGSYIWPAIGNMTSPFGYRNATVGSRNHKGIDICGKLRDPIFAADGGEVTVSRWSSSYGYVTQITHENGHVTMYCHCSKLLVSEGDTVSQGQEIALMGGTGLATAIHLHFELLIDGVNVDPLLYLPE